MLSRARYPLGHASTPSQVVRSEGPGLDTPHGHGVVFLGKTLFSDFPHFTQA